MQRSNETALTDLFWCSTMSAQVLRPGYSPKLGQAICEFISDGGSVRSFCRRPGAPSRLAVRRWLMRHSEFAAVFSMARMIRAEDYADEMIAVADSNGDPAGATAKVHALIRAAERGAPMPSWTKRARTRARPGENL